MADANAVDVVNRSHQLLKVLAGLLLLESLILYNDLKELASLGKFHDQVEVVVCFNDFIELDYVGVMHLLKDLDLS